MTEPEIDFARVRRVYRAIPLGWRLWHGSMWHGGLWTGDAPLAHALRRLIPKLNKTHPMRQARRAELIEHDIAAYRTHLDRDQLALLDATDRLIGR